MKTHRLWVALGIGLAILAPSRGMAQQSVPAASPVKITLLNGNILTGTVGATDADGLTFNLQSGPKRFAWTELDTNELKKTAPALYDQMVALKSGLATAQAAPQATVAGRRGKNDVIAIRLLDGTQLEGIPSRADAKGFSLRTKYATTHYDWSQVDTNALKQVDADLYQTMTEKIREATARPSANATTTIRLRDGTELEGVVTRPDAVGFDFRAKLGTLHYDWNQVDLKHFSQNNPSIYQFYLLALKQQQAEDEIVTDDQIYLFLAGRHVFKSAANKNLKSYGRLLNSLDAIAKIKDISRRSDTFQAFVNSNRAELRAISLRCQQLLSTTGGRAIVHSILGDYHRGVDAVFRGDLSMFLLYYPKARLAVREKGY